MSIVRIIINKEDNDHLEVSLVNIVGWIREMDKFSCFGG